MASIIYRGRSNTRVIEKADFTKLGVEVDFTKTAFPRNEAVEVSAQVAEAILADKRFGDFEAQSTDVPLEESKADSSTAKKPTNR